MLVKSVVIPIRSDFESRTESFGGQIFLSEAPADSNGSCELKSHYSKKPFIDSGIAVESAH